MQIGVGREEAPGMLGLVFFHPAPHELGLPFPPSPYAQHHTHVP